MKFIKRFDSYHINEGAIKRLTQDIVDLAISEKDNWLWKGEGPDGFEASQDRHDFVMNAIDDFNNKYYSDDATTHSFLEENKDGIVGQIVTALEHDMGLESGVIESTINESSSVVPKEVKTIDEFVTFLKTVYPEHIYHSVPTLSEADVFVGMLVKPGDGTLNKKNSPMCVYWNTNYDEYYSSAFPI